MRKKSLLLVAVVLLAGLAGCGTTEDSTQSNSVGNNSMTQVTGEVPSDGTHRFIDEEAGTVCYIHNDDLGSGGAGGMSCLPLNETSLTESGGY